MVSREFVRTGIVLAFMMPFAAHAGDIETASDLLKMCGRDGSSDLSLISMQMDADCATYIKAIHQAHRLLAHDAPLYCVPENSAWPLDGVVTRYLSERRDRLDLPAAAMVMAALGSVFPCR
jgi:hypothetical protein